MNSVKKLNELADKFAMKLSQGQAQVGESNPGPAIQDAFFGPPGPGVGQTGFSDLINKPNSNFQKAASSVQGSISIDVQVNATTKSANFVVKVSGGKPEDVQKLTSALNQDFLYMFKKSPSQFFAERLAAGKIRPANVSGATNFTNM